MADDPVKLLAALRSSHRRLSDLAAPLDAAALRAPSYDDGWSVAQVLSHLGSQAELMGASFDAAIRGDEPPSRDTFAPVWARWDASTPEEQRDASLRTNAEHVAQLGAVGAEGLPDLHMKLFGVMDVDGVQFARMRLNEHALHTWDVAVALDPAAELSADAVDALIDGVGASVGRMAKLEDRMPFELAVATTEPERHLVLVVAAEGASLRPGDPATRAARPTLRLPAAAFLRLLHGRMDADHTPAGVHVDGPGPTLDDLRATFPGS